MFTHSQRPGGVAMVQTLFCCCRVHSRSAASASPASRDVLNPEQTLEESSTALHAARAALTALEHQQLDRLSLSGVNNLVLVRFTRPHKGRINSEGSVGEEIGLRRLTTVEQQKSYRTGPKSPGLNLTIWDMRREVLLQWMTWDFWHVSYWHFGLFGCHARRKYSGKLGCSKCQCQEASTQSPLRPRQCTHTRAERILVFASGAGGSTLSLWAAWGIFGGPVGRHSSPSLLNAA
eukprot:scaffold185412_cov21-Tisochrysis_lutea.AAC.1